MTILWLDYETRSRCPLKSKGAHNYAQDASTEVLCLSYAFDDEDVATWVPADGPQALARVDAHIRGGGQLRAHNATFDRLITEFVLCPDFNITTPALAQWYCTATQARANCAPGSLEDAGRFAGAGMQKDYRGSELIRLLSIPQPDGAFNSDPALMAEMIAYCEQDVRAMRAVSQVLRDLTDDELRDYHINERINDRGMLVDRVLALSAVQYSTDETVDIQSRVVELTDGEIESVRSPRMREWVMARVGPEALDLMTVYKDGVKKYSIDKVVRGNLLAFAEENPDEVPIEVAEVIQCADDLWASAVAKFSRMASMADDEDHRVRGALVFAGGAATGRASSFGIQVHNLPRKCADDPEAVRRAMLRGEAIVPLYGKRVTDILKSMLRPALLPAKGHVLVVSDWSAIEGRVHPWLANGPDGEAKLDVFRRGLDPYKVNAAATFNVHYDAVSKDQRQIGKVQELACGFLGGQGAFTTFGNIYGVHFSEHEARRAVNGWRMANPWAVRHGDELENAYRRAMRNKGREFGAGRTVYFYDGQHLWYMLPSGRILCYPFARFEGDSVTYAKASWKPKSGAKEWPRGRLWRGLACENLTQAAANDILRHSLRQLDADGLRVVLHVHDEIVIECRESDADRVRERLESVMVAAPEWAVGLPLGVEATVMARYGK